MKYLLLLLLTGRLAAQGLFYADVQVRVVSFEKAGSDTTLAAAAPNCDEALYASLTKDAAAGKARRVHDQTVVIRSGQRAKSQAGREIPSVINMRAIAEKWLWRPERYEWRSAGEILEAEAFVGDAWDGWPQHPVDLNIAPEWGGLLTRYPWPVPDLRAGGRMGRAEQPVFGRFLTQSQLLTWTGRTNLLSVALAPGAAFSAAKEPVFRYTFVRAGVDGEKPARPGNPPMTTEQRRLHALTIRLPRDEAALLLLQHAGDDAALYGKLLQLVSSGAAAVSSHTAVYCRRGQRSKVVSAAEFPFPSGYQDLIPTRWNTLMSGNELEVEANSDEAALLAAANDYRQAEEYSRILADWRVSLELLEGLEVVPYHPSAAQPALHGGVLEYVVRQFRGQVHMPASGVLCGGVLSTTPATEEPEHPGGLTDVCMLLQYPLPSPDLPALGVPDMFLQGVIFSVPAAEGPALAATAKAAETVPTLLERLAAGEITCAGHCGVVIHNGERAETRCVRDVSMPNEYGGSASDEKFKLPLRWEVAQCGLSLEVDNVIEKDTASLSVFLQWDTAEAAGFGEPGAVIPGRDQRRNTQEIKLKDFKLARGQAVAADVRVSNAREGTPEHGRWHVLVLLAR